MKEGYIVAKSGITIIYYDDDGQWFADRGLLTDGGKLFPGANNIVAIFKVKRRLKHQFSGNPLPLVFGGNDRKITKNFDKARTIMP